VAIIALQPGHIESLSLFASCSYDFNTAVLATSYFGVGVILQDDCLGIRALAEQHDMDLSFGKCYFENP
jgi:hypothetical protein